MSNNQHAVINYNQDYLASYTNRSLVDKEYVDTQVSGATGTAFVWTQGVASNTWNINHNLGYKPGGIKVFDSADAEWFGNVIYVDNNNLTINFGSASFTGKAYLS